MKMQTISNYIKNFGIKIPEYFWKEEVVRYLAEQKTERLVEIPFIFQNIPKKRVRILDVGCRYSLVSLQLASLGHDVYAIDILEYKRKHPNLHFDKADITKAPYKNNFFDIALSISTIEHIGLSAYGDEKNENGDRDSVDEIYRVLKKKGKFLLTIPFGKAKDYSWFRVYDRKRLKNLLKKFTILELKVYCQEKGYWVTCSPEKAEKIRPGDDLFAGVAFVVAEK